MKGSIKQTHKDINKQNCTRTYTHIDRQTHRQTDRQAGRQTERATQRETKTHTCAKKPKPIEYKYIEKQWILQTTTKTFKKSRQQQLETNATATCTKGLKPRQSNAPDTQQPVLIENTKCAFRIPNTFTKKQATLKSTLNQSLVVIEQLYCKGLLEPHKNNNKTNESVTDRQIDRLTDRLTH